ncbi:hypothetical protein AGOR_G00016450 [Albula goreensis]|uniref:Poly [ADP-ribose] polymerase 12 n=1 Tax=Albula goreensis TaxID=1534307 RepID=A0A8T3E8N4_9TELE|nr:hypothetical protein AGOR_G00016450 [Albula goreensis]
MSAVSNLITKVVCENQGCLDYKRLSQTLRQSITAPESNIVAILRDTSKFVIVEGKEKRDGNSALSADSLVIAKTSLRVCQKRVICDNCPNLHLCRYFLCGECKFGNKCKHSHDLDLTHNKEVLTGQGLQELKAPALFQLLLQNDTNLLPEICRHYNRGSGEHGSCEHMERCNNLHVCQHFLQDNCNYGAGCKRAHNFNDSAVKILTSRGVSLANLSILKNTYKNRFAITGHTDQPAGLSTRKKETECTQTPSVPPKVSCEELFRALPNPNLIYCPLGSPAAPPAAPVVKERSHHQSSASISEADSNEICLFFIRGSCSFEEKCTRVHHRLPYRWQVLSLLGNTWNDLTNMESIEQAYCNPAKDSSELSPQVNFLTMTSGYSKVRRLSTASSVNKPPHFILTTDWLWYWKNDKGGWSEFGTEPDPKTRASITSKDLEKVYQTNTGIDIHITAGKNRYLVLIKDMFQQNITTKKKREIRRRPRFVSGQEVEKKLKSGTSEAAGSSTMTVPEQWDKKALPEYGYKLIPLSDCSTEFQQVAQLFKRTMYQSTIRSIQRIQNPSLYRVFQWQKEQMQLRTGGRVVEQKLLFHGTDKSFMPAICEQNFDWRICGTNGTAYGKGSYFARDASYSDKYSKPKSVPKSMFGVQVLVGEYTKGTSSYKRPPPNYDSCVDSVNNPAIFVIFEKYQIYPEYIIEYS